VQRGLKFVKYIAASGWETHVIAPKGSIRKVTDYSLLDEIPASAHLHRVAGLGLMVKSESRMVQARFAHTAPRNPMVKAFWGFVKLINDLLFPFDKQIGWMPFALCKAIKLIRKHQIRNVFISAFPFSGFLVGIALKWIFKSKIFWIADYRDAWQFAPLIENFVLPFRYRIISKMDDIVLAKCDKAVFVTDHIRQRYIRHLPWLHTKAEVITNGYDESDFQALKAHKYNKLTFLLMGKVHGIKGSPLPFLEALAKSGLKDFQVIHIGSLAADVREQINAKGYDFFHFEGYKSHLEALNYAAGADVNLIILNDDPASVGVYSGKLFELLRIGKPILAMGPPVCIISDLLTQTDSGIYAHLNNQQELIEKIRYLANQDQNPKPAAGQIESYSRQNLAQQLLEIYMQNSTQEDLPKRK
jgi:glycosyltransferase involved in cell wall biosynthesis